MMPGMQRVAPEPSALVWLHVTVFVIAVDQGT